jgi:hypothetical protein
MFLVCHLAHRPPDADSLAAFVSRYPQGLLLTRSNSSFSADYRFAVAARTTAGAFGDAAITLTLVAGVDWPARQPARLSLFHYSLKDPAAHPSTRVDDALWLAPGCSPQSTAQASKDGEDGETD